jgi:hypothetical protein
MGVEVIAKLGMVDELAREQPFDALATPLGGAAGSALRLTAVLDADGGEQTVAERRLLAEQTTKVGARNFGPLRLFGEEVPEEGVASEVATQDGVEGNAVARIQTGLGEQNQWNGRSVALTSLEHGEPMIDGGSEGSIETSEVGRVNDVAGIGDRVDAGRNSRLNLRQTLA